MVYNNVGINFIYGCSAGFARCSTSLLNPSHLCRLLYISSFRSPAGNTTSTSPTELGHISINMPFPDVGNSQWPGPDYTFTRRSLSTRKIIPPKGCSGWPPAHQKTHRCISPLNKSLIWSTWRLLIIKLKTLNTCL